MPYKDTTVQREYFKNYDLQRGQNPIRLEYKKKYFQDNKKEIAEKKRVWYHEADRLPYHQNWSLKKKFGITLEQYNKMFEEQGGKCSICRGSTTYGKKRKLSVDHCHKTNKVRGLLCDPCNLGLGKFKDSTEILLKALNYLKSYEN